MYSCFLVFFFPEKSKKECEEYNFPNLQNICSNYEAVSLGGSATKNPPPNAGYMGLIPGLGTSPEEGNGNPLQYSFCEIPWTEETVGYSVWGHERVGHNLTTSSVQCD